jgi:hypothetical protein
MIKIAVLCVRKQWNNAPSFLIEGIKNGIRNISIKNIDFFKDIQIIFVRLDIHEPERLYIDPKKLKGFDFIIFPIWIGKRISKCNLFDIKSKTNAKIISYSGFAPFDDKKDFEITNNEYKFLSNNQEELNNFNSIDKFFVIKKKYINNKEIEIGCGQFDWIYPEKSDYNGIIVDFCKINWDEPIYYNLKKAYSDILKKCNVQFIQFGNYPFVFEKCGNLYGPTSHYRRICKVYNKSKIFICMNESFGYPILENQYAGNYIFLHEDAKIPSFYLKSNNIILWNTNNIVNKINNVLNNYSKNTPFNIRNDFIENYPNLISWEKTVRNIINEIQNF